MRPRLSVVMPALNAGPFLAPAMESILGQDFGDFEFVILDDGSDDGTAEALKDWALGDRRIRLFLGGLRRGPVGSSQFVVEQARTPFIARMDADDVARPNRLARQFETLEADPETVLVGALAETIDGEGRVTREADRRRMVQPSSLLTPFNHSTILFRRDAFLRAGGYLPGTEKWEDVDLYLRMARQGRILVLNEVLSAFRTYGASSRTAEGYAALEAAMDALHERLDAYRLPGANPGEVRPREAARRRRPASFVPGGAIRLWSGMRPDMLGRVLTRADLRPDRETLAVLSWALLGQASPGLLRGVLKAGLRWGNAAAEKKLRSTPVVEWAPFGRHCGSATMPLRPHQR